jgi:hypothetical protein
MNLENYHYIAMRQGPDYFEARQEELVLLYIARKLRHALQVERALTEAGIDYLVEVDFYSGGVIFRSERAGAFIYVPNTVRDFAGTVIRQKGFAPVEENLR